jgi:hypothetical protein
VNLAEGEIAREATRVLRKLMAPSARLAPIGKGYALMGQAQGREKKQLSVSAPVVEAFRRRDWIAPAATPGSYVLSDAGLGWIRRALAQGDPFADQHRIAVRREIESGEGHVTVTVNDGESPLGWLYRRKGPDGRSLIGDHQFAAGERLRADFTMAQMSPRMTVDLTAPVVAGRRGARADVSVPEMVLAAKQRVTRALGAVGPGLSDLLLDVCCHLIGLEAAERQKGWPQRSAKVVLCIALDRLAAHYGTAAVIGTGSRLRAWSAPEDRLAGENIAREP